MWPPGSADTVCPRPPLTLTVDRLILKLVCESHLRWGTFLPNLGTLGLWVLELFATYATDGQTDRRTTLITPFPTITGQNCCQMLLLFPAPSWSVNIVFQWLNDGAMVAFTVGPLLALWTPKAIVPHRIIRSWYTGRWVGCYIWYSKEGPGRSAVAPSPLLAVPNVTAHPSTASIPITVLLYDGPLLCGFSVAIKGLTDACRNRKALESRSLADDERITFLETQLKEAKYISEDADRKYDEVTGRYW